MTSTYSSNLKISLKNGIQYSFEHLNADERELSCAMMRKIFSLIHVDVGPRKSNFNHEAIKFFSLSMKSVKHLSNEDQKQINNYASHIIGLLMINAYSSGLKSTFQSSLKVDLNNQGQSKLDMFCVDRTLAHLKQMFSHFASGLSFYCALKNLTFEVDTDLYFVLKPEDLLTKQSVNRLQARADITIQTVDNLIYQRSREEGRELLEACDAQRATQELLQELERKRQRKQVHKQFRANKIGSFRQVGSAQVTTPKQNRVQKMGAPCCRPQRLSKEQGAWQRFTRRLYRLNSVESTHINQPASRVARWSKYSRVQAVRSTPEYSQHSDQSFKEQKLKHDMGHLVCLFDDPYFRSNYAFEYIYHNGRSRLESEKVGIIVRMSCEHGVRKGYVLFEINRKKHDAFHARFEQPRQETTVPEDVSHLLSRLGDPEPDRTNQWDFPHVRLYDVANIQKRILRVVKKGGESVCIYPRSKHSS